MFYSPSCHWKGFHIRGVIFQFFGVKCFCLKLGTSETSFLPSHSLFVKNNQELTPYPYSSYCSWSNLVLYSHHDFPAPVQWRQRIPRNLLIKDFELTGKASFSPLRHLACSWAVPASLMPFSPCLLRYTSMLCEYLDLFWHIILFRKMGITTAQGSQVDNQCLGCSLSKLTDPHKYQFRSAACKHYSWTSSSVLSIVFNQKKEKKKEKTQPTKPPLDVSPTGPTSTYLAMLCWVCWKPRKRYHPSVSLTQSTV